MVSHSLLWCSWLFGQENLSHVVHDNLEKPGKAGQSGHMNLRRSALFFFSPQLSLQFRCTLCAQTYRQYP